MHYNLRVKENEAFTTSLYEIKCIIQDRKAPEINAIDPIWPQEYKEYLNVSSKEESNKLPPSQLYNHRIELQNQPRSN
jgi:hypothetical protein